MEQMDDVHNDLVLSVELNWNQRFIKQCHLCIYVLFILSAFLTIIKGRHVSFFRD